MFDLAAFSGFPFEDEHDLLYAEAMGLFEQCLADGKEAPLRLFIERQLAAEPPQTALLADILDELERRLLTLRSHYRDVRDQNASLLRESFGVDLRAVPPALLTAYHEISTEGGIAFVQAQCGLGEADLVLLQSLLATSLRAARAIHADIEVTARLVRWLGEWLMALNATAARRHWRPVDLDASGAPPTQH